MRRVNGGIRTGWRRPLSIGDTFQTRTVLSNEAVALRLPSGDQHTLHTMSVCLQRQRLLARLRVPDARPVVRGAHEPAPVRAERHVVDRALVRRERRRDLERLDVVDLDRALVVAGGDVLPSGLNATRKM